MGALANVTIEEMCRLRDQKTDSPLIYPFSPGQLQPNSYDVLLSDHYMVEKVPEENKPVRLGEKKWKKRRMENGEMVLQPGELVLCSTVEHFHIPPRVAGRVEGKSSWGRMGILVHVTAGLIDSGFDGDITLEIKNVGHTPVVLQANTPIAQVLFERAERTSDGLYGHDKFGSHYQGQSGPTPART